MDGKGFSKWRRKLLFAELASPSEIATILAQAEQRTYACGATIFHEGDESTHLYVIAEGSVRFNLHDDKHELDEQLSGEYFGELGLFDSHPRSATATATLDTTCEVIEQGALLSWLEASPKVAIALLRHATLRIRDLSAERASRYRRVVDYIERNAVQEGLIRVVRPWPTQTWLALRLQMSREHLSKILGALKELKCVTEDDGCLTVWKPIPKTF